MGEVVVQVKMTNSLDEMLARRGKLEVSEVRCCEVAALVDTGAVNRQEEVGVTEPVLMEILGRKIYEECLVLGDTVLIGRTALEVTDLHVDCREGKLLPNPAHPYQPVVMVR